MKLAFSPASPYVRKVTACAIKRGINDRIERLKIGTTDPELLKYNALSKVPTLITDDGTAIFDSPVICEYLDSREDGIPMFPRTAAARWIALKQQAMGDGVMDAAVARRGESLRPKEEARLAAMARRKAAIDRTLAMWEADLPHRTVDIGTITIGCALGYLDFRFAHEPWRETCPRLAAWFAAFSVEPCMARTVPRDPAG